MKKMKKVLAGMALMSASLFAVPSFAGTSSGWIQVCLAPLQCYYANEPIPVNPPPCCWI